jgi:hypothetical protein
MNHDDDTCPHLVLANLLEAENARLKAEVEELKSQPDPLTAYLYADTLRRDDIKTLKAHIERLTKAGDDLYAEVGIHSRHHNCGSRDEWLRAKKGLPSLKEQYEKQKVLGWDFVRPPMPNAAKEGKGQP